jgi:hypothetical protein
MEVLVSQDLVKMYLKLDNKQQVFLIQSINVVIITRLTIFPMDSRLAGLNEYWDR